MKAMIELRKGSDGSWWVYRLAPTGRVELLDSKGDWQPVVEGVMNPNPTIPSKPLVARYKENEGPTV